MSPELLPIAFSVEDVLFDVANALRIPVLVAALLAAVIVTLEVGALLMELRRRRKRGIPRLEQALDIARGALARGDTDGAVLAVRELGFNRAMSDVLASIVEQRGRPDAGDRIAKRMAEYDYRSMKRLERTRILVRAGPALGLMGTLIPLSPALEALAEGDISSLTDELRVAFSVTVAGLLIGMVAFGVSLVRDRLYAQDYSDVEYVAAALGYGAAVSPDGAAPAVSPVAGTAAPVTGAPGTHAPPTAHPQAPPATPPPVQAAPASAASPATHVAPPTSQPAPVAQPAPPAVSQPTTAPADAPTAVTPPSPDGPSAGAPAAPDAKAPPESS